jgi:hypothetical protein
MSGLAEEGSRERSPTPALTVTSNAVDRRSLIPGSVIRRGLLELGSQTSRRLDDDLLQRFEFKLMQAGKHKHERARVKVGTKHES